MKKKIIIPFLSLLFAVCFFFLEPYIPFLNAANNKIYDSIQKLHYKLSKPPSEINDILLVPIGNPTLLNIPQRWPYPRSYFAKVIQNLKAAGVKAIAFDFVFYGQSTPEDDLLIKKAMEDDEAIILASSIDEEGFLNIFPFAHIEGKFNSGIITKVQDSDGVVRKSLTYLVSEKEKHQGFLSWEIEILKTVKNINLATFASFDKLISFESFSKEKWLVPVEKKSKAFWINYRAHTADFPAIDFYKILNNDFDAKKVKGKIAIIGLVSSLFADIHNTPIGWLPGVTLNANAFLTLYSKEFLTSLPTSINIIILLAGVIIASLAYVSFKRKPALLLVLLETLVFFAFSYFLFASGYICKYSLFPLVVFVCPYLSVYIYSKIEPASGRFLQSKHKPA